MIIKHNLGSHVVGNLFSTVKKAKDLELYIDVRTFCYSQSADGFT